MTLSSKKNLAGFAIALMILALAAWMSSSLLSKPKTAVVGTVEVTDLSN